MKKRLVILLLVFTFVFSFAISVFTNEAGNKGPTVDLEEGKLNLSAPTPQAIQLILQLLNKTIHGVFN